jgi:hypothetical protein
MEYDEIVDDAMAQCVSALMRDREVLINQASNPPPFLPLKQ